VIVDPASLIPLAAGSSSAPADGRVATVIGFALTGAYAGALAWLHIRRWRSRRPARRQGAASLAPDASRSSSDLSSSPPAESITTGDDSAPAERRLPGETLEPLGRQLARSRRMAAAEARVADVLDQLPAEGWLVERYVVAGGQRVPFLLFGQTGVFAVWALDDAAGWDDLPFVNRAAEAIRELLPGYGGEVHVGLCRAFDPVRPRWWYAADSGAGAWLLGLQWLEAWLEHFGDGHGLAPGDLEAVAALARRPARPPRRPGLPRTPNVG
jgi:hypothetical protein